MKNYFFNNAVKLNKLILDVYENTKEGKVLMILKAIGKKEFTHKEFLEKAEQLNLAKESYGYKLLRQSKLLIKISRGTYQTDIFD